MDWLLCELTGTDHNLANLVLSLSLPFLFCYIFFSNSFRISSCNLAICTASCRDYSLWTLTDFSNSVFGPDKKKLNAMDLDTLTRAGRESNASKYLPKSPCFNLDNSTTGSSNALSSNRYATSCKICSHDLSLKLGWCI